MHTILTKLRENGELKNFAENTIITYCTHAKKFMNYFPDKDPWKLESDEIRQYLLI